MAVIWQYKLNGIEIDEPIGFADIVFNTLRDELWHGVFFEASTSQLSFYGAAFDMLTAAKATDFVDAEVIFTADSRCEGEIEFTNVITGKLNFANYQELCGNQCLVRLAVEQDSCAMVFKNRFDQKVNIDSNIAFDNMTVLADYAGLGFNMQLATQVIPISTDAEVSLENDVTELDGVVMQLGEQNILLRPIYARVNDNSVRTGELDDPSSVFQDPTETVLISPQVLLEENQDCILTPYTYDIRFHYIIDVDFTQVPPSLATVTARLCIDYWDGEGTHVGPGNLQGDAFSIVDELMPDIDGEFDRTYTGTINVPQGVGFYAYLKLYYSAGFTSVATVDVNLTWLPDTHFILTNDKACPPTDCDVYLINETLSHVTESITDNCLKVKSDYYGRTDSEPFASTQDGCGGLRIFTPGLKIRQAADKFFFASMKELMMGLRAIDNIGMGMEPDQIRIEPAQYFYQNVKIMDILLVPQSVTDIDNTRIYSNIKCGYNKWEIKSTKGIDEFNSYKERRTGIKAVNNELDITCDLIASGYIIENLRTLTLVNSGNTDNTYDNDVFIICAERDGYGYHVEQGVSSGSNFYSPATAYNWRIRPLYNVMRWFKSIAQCYTNYFNSTSKIFFTKGNGNYLAKGQLPISDPCRLESGPLAENIDIDYTSFQNSNTYPPIYKAETITFNYPLSIKDYKRIKEIPYGFISVQCGTGDIIKTYIKSIEYKPAAGTADFVLIKAWP